MCPQETFTVIGVDGCRGGWLAAEMTLVPTGHTPRLDFTLHTEFKVFLAATQHALRVVDIPIGLLDQAETGGRPCDRHARRILGPRRGSSVFPPPARPALGATEYREAIRLNGAGMSQQAFHIIPKIREVDEAIGPGGQENIYEGHPELSFMRLAGGPVIEPKRRTAGRTRRQRLIETELGCGIDPAGIRTQLGRNNVAQDDILDAAVLALSGVRIARGNADRIGNGERDARGLKMAMWY